MGKTTLLENMLIQDIKNGHGLAFIDPHGDTAEKILDFIPPERINDVIYFNPADFEYPIAFNVVEQVDVQLRHLVASGLVGVFKKLWADSWGPRLEYILRNAILAILDYPGSTLLAVTRMLADKAFRKKVVEKIQDPVVRSFWVNEFAGYADKFASEAVAPIQNKVGQFLSTSLIRNVVGQVKSTIDLRDIMDNGKILIMNLSKGRIGEDNSALLGAMMITKIQLAAMTRVDTLEKDRKDFFLYVDEFQNFATEAFANILSEARKYRLNLIMAHQFIEQLDNELVRAAVFGNVGTLVMFRVGATDAAALAKELAPRFTEEDLVNLTKFEIYLKLMINGMASEPFSAQTLPPLFKPESTDTAQKVIRVSRERYARERTVVEEKINRWSEPIEGSELVTVGVKKIKTTEIDFKGQRLMAEVADDPTPDRHIAWLCDNCQKVTYLSFQPNPRKPVYCKKCLRDYQKGVMAPAAPRLVLAASPATPAATVVVPPGPPAPPKIRASDHIVSGVVTPQPNGPLVATIPTPSPRPTIAPTAAPTATLASQPMIPPPTEPTAVEANDNEPTISLGALEQQIKGGQDTPRGFDRGPRPPRDPGSRPHRPRRHGGDRPRHRPSQAPPQ